MRNPRNVIGRMGRFLALIALAVSLPSSSTLADPPDIELRPLAPRPLCEASAAVFAPWDGDRVLVADNEVEDQLYVFKIRDGMVPVQTLALPEGERPKDIEALARVGRSLLVVGSHSRNSRCVEKPKRQHMRLFERRSDGSLEEKRRIEGDETLAKALRSERKCRKKLFTKPAPPLAEEVCRALIEAEEVARSGASCPVLNIEGALGDEDQRGGRGRRAPLAEGRAMLLRLTPELDALRFDGVALLDLEGRGVRELTLEGRTVYGIGGPVEDAADPFLLFSIDLDELGTGGSLAPEILRRDLVTSSEGMVVEDGAAWITVDGDEGELECEVPSRHYRVGLDEEGE